MKQYNAGNSWQKDTKLWTLLHFLLWVTWLWHLQYINIGQNLVEYDQTCWVISNRLFSSNLLKRQVNGPLETDLPFMISGWTFTWRPKETPRKAPVAFRGNTYKVSDWWHSRPSFPNVAKYANNVPLRRLLRQNELKVLPNSSLYCLDAIKKKIMTNTFYSVVKNLSTLLKSLDVDLTRRRTRGKRQKSYKAN